MEPGLVLLAYSSSHSTKCGSKRVFSEGGRCGFVLSVLFPLRGDRTESRNNCVQVAKGRGHCQCPELNAQHPSQVITVQRAGHTLGFCSMVIWQDQPAQVTEGGPGVQAWTLTDQVPHLPSQETQRAIPRSTDSRHIHTPMHMVVTSETKFVGAAGALVGEWQNLGYPETQVEKQKLHQPC